MPMDIGNNLKGPINESRMHDIKDFLGRPFKCTSGLWTTSAAAGSQLVTMPFPTHVLSNPMYTRKLDGFLGFRATTVIRVQVNGERFQQGRLILHYLPMAKWMSSARVNTSLAYLSTITQQPRVDFDLSTDTEVKLRIPFINVWNYYNLVDTSGSWGTFYLSVYSPLVSPGGPNDVAFSIWCHFEDVELEFPTLSTQMAITSSRTHKGDPTTSEAAEAGVGPISGLISRVSRATGILSEIPLLTSFTAPVSWAADVFARSAKSMGWSKPSHMGNANRIIANQFPDMANVDGVDTSIKLALSKENHIENLPGFAGTDIDEMSIGYLAKIPAFIYAFNWQTTSTEGTELVILNCNPNQLYGGYTQSNGTVSKSVRVYPPAGYLANLFTYWRGSITFTFKLVKTEFHSGRLVFAFAPGPINPTNFTYASTQYLYKEVVDIRSTTEVRFTVPYVATTPYLDMFSITGCVKVFVLNPLRAPSTVSSSISILTEVSYGDDFELSFHIPPVSTNYRPMLTQIAIGEQPENSTSANVTELQPGIGSSSLQLSTELSESRYCIGERILSVRQLLKRFCTLWSFSGTNANHGCKIMAHCVTLQRFIAGSPIPASTINIDMINYIAPMYAFMRGSERYKYLQGSANNRTAYYLSWLTNRYNDTESGFPYTLQDLPNRDVTFWQARQAEAQHAGIEIEVPGYCGLHTRIVNTNEQLVVGTALGRDYANNAIAYVGTYDTVNTAQLWRAAGDDFSLGFFIGTVPLVAP